MAISNKPLVEGEQLGASVAVLYTVPASTTSIVKKLTVTNTSASAVTVTIYLVPKGGTPSAANCVTSGQAIAPGAVYEAFEAENQALATGDTLQAFASAAASVSLRASGMEIV
jgi:hypothetical protein